MKRTSIYKHYEPAVSAPDKKSPTDLWLVFYENKVLINPNSPEMPFPETSALDFYTAGNTALSLYEEAHYLGTYKDRPCYCIEVSSSAVPEGFQFTELRPLFLLLSEDLFLLTGKASQILLWDKSHRFCGVCGEKTQQLSDERAKKCPACGHISYPRISPAIIVSIVRDNKLLLARSTNFVRKMYSVLAGFLEPGETLEECVHREVMEEVGIRVKNVKYFGSQPWPFPHSMMVGFTAEYESGEIKIDEKEIAEADWYTVDQLPEIPTTISISGELIENFRKNYSKA